MWFGGLVVGVGTALGDWTVMPCGAVLSVLGALYIRRFAETD